MNEKINLQESKKRFYPLYFLLIIFSVTLIIRFYYIPFDIPITLDGEHYFWYANDLSILKQLPVEYSSQNNFWPTVLSFFFSINQSNEILDYMNLQRILSVVISSFTIFPMYFLCKKFFPSKYAIIGASSFVLEPRIIINSFLGITEPIYFLVGISIILFSLNKNYKFHYISFGLTAIFSLIRYEGLIILAPVIIAYFWQFKINKKSLIKFSLCMIVFALVLLPMISIRIQTTGEDGLTSHIFAGTNYVSNTFSGTYEKQDRTDFLKDGTLNSIMFLGWITIPIWILFLPYGIWKYFKKLNFERGTLLLFSIILILPAIYAYSRDIPETRYLYILFPIFTIFSLYTIEKISREKNFKLIASLIILGIIVSSVGWVEYKWIDKEYEKEAFELSFKIKESTNGINQFYPESTYLKFIDTEKKFPKLKNEVFEQHKIFPITEYQNIEELLLNEQKNGLTHIITDKSQNSKNQRPEFLIDIFENENKYNFLEKIYDSKDDGYNYHLKIFKIDYNLFNNGDNQN